jgi:hypothetical protein
MDVHVPGAISRQLRRHGVDVLTAQEDGRGTAIDEQVLERATEFEIALRPAEHNPRRSLETATIASSNSWRCFVLFSLS